MTIDLRGRSFLKEADFTKEEFTYLDRRGRTTEGGEEFGIGGSSPRWPQHRSDLRKDLDPHTVRLRSGRS